MANAVIIQVFVRPPDLPNNGVHDFLFGGSRVVMSREYVTMTSVSQLQFELFYSLVGVILVSLGRYMGFVHEPSSSC